MLKYQMYQNINITWYEMFKCQMNENVYSIYVKCSNQIMKMFQLFMQNVFFLRT